MKKIITTLIAGLILWLSALPAVAQKAHKAPKYVPAKGYWVVESRNDSSIVYFYSDSLQLISKKELAGTLNVGRRRTKLRLKRALAKTVTAWEKDQLSISRQNTPIYRQMMNGDTSEAAQP
jgi:hypothetical protein